MAKKAEYQISTSVNNGILEITLTGEVKESDVKNLQDQVIAIETETQSKNVLMDVRSIKGCFGYTETFHRVRSYPPEKLKTNVAVVDKPENSDYENFQEVTAKNADDLSSSIHNNFMRIFSIHLFDNFFHE